MKSKDLGACYMQSCGCKWSEWHDFYHHSQWGALRHGCPPIRLNLGSVSRHDQENRSPQRGPVTSHLNHPKFAWHSSPILAHLQWWTPRHDCPQVRLLIRVRIKIEVGIYNGNIIYVFYPIISHLHSKWYSILHIDTIHKYNYLIITTKFRNYIQTYIRPQNILELGN